MDQIQTLRRRLHIIRIVDRPFLYPSLKKLVAQLSEDFDAVSERTVERDIRAIGAVYQIYIRNNRRKGGYYLDLPTDEDVADFEQFVQLLERRERLEFLTSSVASIRGIGRHLQLEHNTQFTGNGHLPLLWQALQTGRCVEFVYRKFEKEADEGKLRRVEPGLLLEYRNRFYLDCFDLEANQPRTFGLDRLHGLTLTDQPISTARTGQRRTDRRHAIGVTCPPDLEPQRVVLRFQTSEANYVRSLPLHSSQRLIQEVPGFVDLELTVILNHELEREILAFGELVEVLEPAELRVRLAARVRILSEKYF
ncbi:WYL domain-containing protein [Spirosoma sp. SC4-14]|uniref:helix-turn-helix transcriptional regulator n=1 Tax=Spirosoma sp. SC4-14 TaxID=3128900 RepID=UPI0030D1FD5D